MAITTVKHCDRFFALCQEFQLIGQRFVRGKRADLFAWAVRVLEMARKAQIDFLISCGRPEESITEDMLGFPLTWKLFSERAQRHYSPRSFESIIESVINAGVASRYYVECHRRKRRGGGEELILVGDERGRPVLYATLEEAMENRISDGEVINYFYLHATTVNTMIEEIYGLSKPAPQPPTAPTGGIPKPGKGDAQRTPAEQSPGEENQSVREGNSETDQVFSVETIPQGSHFCEGTGTPKTRRYQKFQSSQSADGAGLQICEGNARRFARQGSQIYEGNPRKSASNKNNNKIGKESTEENNLISVSRHAVDPLLLSQFDFSQPITQESVLQLARLIYPPLPVCYKSELDKEAACAKEAAAAQAIAEWPLSQNLGLRHLAATMIYQVDESSPCGLRAYCRKGDPARGRAPNPGLPMRLCQIKSEMVLYKMSQERADAGWWPEYLPHNYQLVESPPEIDLAELAGIDLYERVGMDRQTCQDVLAWLSDLLIPHGYEIRSVPVGPRAIRGYAIEVWYAHEDGGSRALRFYSFDQWELILKVEESAPLGSPEFVRCLSEALRQVA